MTTSTQQLSIGTVPPDFSDDQSSVTLFKGSDHEIVLPLLPGAGSPDGTHIKVYGKFVPFSGKVAEALLARNENNRNISEATCHRYADDMLTSRWKVTSQGIQLDANGHVQDGQHRCKARLIALQQDPSGIDPILWLSMGYERLSMLAVDTGLKRRVPASAKIAGITLRDNSPELIQAKHESMLMAMFTDWQKQGKVPQFSNTRRIDMITRFADPIEWITERTECESYLTMTSVRAPIAAAFLDHKDDPDTLSKIIQFKNMIDRPFYEPDKPCERENQTSNFDMESADFWPGAVRRDCEKGKKEKKAGVAFRNELGRKTCVALYQFIKGTEPPRNSQIGFCPGSKSYLVVAEDAPWNDNTWRSKVETAESAGN